MACHSYIFLFSQYSTVISQLALLTGEEDLSHPPVLPTQVKSRFRNGHASFRLRMLQEQHGSGGFEPVSTVLLSIIPFFDSLCCLLGSESVDISRASGWQVCIRGN